MSYFILELFSISVQSVPITYIPDLAISKGIPRTDAALLISVIGVTNIMGRIVAGFIVDFLKMPSLVVYTVALFVAAVINFMFPLCNSFALLAVCAGLFGLCMGE